MGHVLDLDKLPRKEIEKKYNIFKLDHDDWESMFKTELASGKPMIIIDGSDENLVEKLRTNSMKNSIFDPRFNVPVNIDDSAIDCVCECGQLYGRYNEGEICKSCETKVELRYELELSKHGWIDLSPYKIIIPSMYNKLVSFIGRKKFESILHVDSISGISKVDPKNPFFGIGMMEFERRFVEVMEYFNRNTKKPELYKEIMIRKDLVFSSKIYVMSSALRPGFASLNQNNLKFHSINGFFMKILTDMKLVKSGRRTGRQVPNILETVQENLMQIHDLAFYKTFGNKKKLARGDVISTRKFYSSRHVIISESTTKDIDCIRISYKGFINQFELEIINAMLTGCAGVDKFMHMTMLEAKLHMKKLNYLDRIDPDIWDICMSLINNRKDDGLWVVNNRNPSLDLGSIQTMKIVGLMEDVRDLVLTIPHNSLVEFCGDYDGDALNTFSPKEKCVVDAMQEFKPSKLIIDRTGGYFNGKMAPIKDELVFLKNLSDPIFGQPLSKGLDYDKD
jgi:hypothetical protein